jgi:DNA-binding LacI/PurR family transcriptional regulator
METKIKREYGISLHYKIRKEIEKFIRENNFENEILPPEEEIAKRFKVSRGTVRRAILDLVNQGVLYRIPGKGTFINKKTLSIEKITIFSPWGIEENTQLLKDSYVDVLLREIRKNAIKNGYTLILKNLEKEEIEFTEMAKETNGIIILNPRRNEDEIIDRVSKFSIPSVFIGANLKRDDVNYVCVDNKNGIRKAVEYLISLGHKYLFFIGGSPESYDTYERYEAFINICNEKNIKHKEVIFESNLDWKKEMKKIIFKILKDQNLPDGIITGGLFITLCLLKAIKKIKIKIPEDFSLIGFDDFPLFSHLNPPLTAISQPIEKLAENGFKILEDSMKGKKGKIQVILDTKLLIRKSVKRR